MIAAQALDAIARILVPLTPDQFFADVLGRQVATVEGSPDHPRAALLGPDPRATLLGAHAELLGRFGIHADGVTGPPPAKDGVADPDSFARLIAEHHARGYTVHLADLAPLSPPLALLTRAFELMLHAPVKTSVFWSRPGNRAPVHYDDRDNLIVQLVGAKRWYVAVAPPSLHNPWRDVAEAAPPLGQHRTIDTTPGRLLFIPRGVPHTVETTEESLHLSITMLPLTVRNAIGAALDHLSDYDRSLRETALTRSDRLGAELGQVQAAVVAGLERLLAQARQPGFVGSALQRRASRAIGALPKLPPSPMPALGPDTMLDHADGAISLTLATLDALDLALPGAHLTVHAAAGPALRYIAAHPHFRLGDLPGLDGPLRIALAERLLAAGYLRAADGGKSS